MDDQSGDTDDDPVSSACMENHRSMMDDQGDMDCGQSETDTSEFSEESDHDQADPDYEMNESDRDSEEVMAPTGFQ